MAAELAILPWAFWSLTPSELYGQWRGYQKRIEGEYYRLAWLACHLPLAMGVKKGTKLTPDKLLGKKPEKQRNADERLRQTARVKP